MKNLGPMTLNRYLRTRTEYSELIYFVPQLEQVEAEQVPQEELAVLLNFPPAEKAKADITR